MKAGDKCYTEQGEECRFVALTSDGAVVRPIYGDDDGGERAGRPVVVPEVFAQPPTQVYDQRVATLRAEVNALSARVSSLRAEVREGESARRASAARLSQIPVLANIEAILDGKVTHAALFSEYGTTRVKVLPLSDALATDDGERLSSWSKKLKLVTLFGRSGGDLQWNISQYSDGGGSSHTALFFTSEEAARSAAMERIAEELAACAADGRRSAEEWVASAMTFGVEVPAALSDRLTADKRTQAANKVAELAAKLEAAQAALAAVNGQPAAAPARDGSGDVSERMPCQSICSAQ